MSERIVELTVRLSASPAVVFPYFTDPELYVRWQGIKAELDPRPGGLYRVWMDDQTVARGEYVHVDAPHKVVFTWGWENDSSVPPGSTRVELTITPDADGSMLLLRHFGLPNDAAAAMHTEGWKHFTALLEVAVRPDDDKSAPS